MRELPPGERSIAMTCSLRERRFGTSRPGAWSGGRRRTSQGVEPAFETREPALQVVTVREMRSRCHRREAGIVSPPVQSDLFRLVDRAYEKANLNREQLHVRQVDLDVSRNDEAFVQHPVENLNEAVAACGNAVLGQSAVLQCQC